MFSGIKSDFSRILLDSRGKIAYGDDLFAFEEDFCDVISLKAERANKLKFYMFTGFMRTITSTKFQINQLTLTLFSGSRPKSPPHS